MEETTLQFKGFTPPSFIAAYFKDLVDEIHRESPTWSTVRATIHREGRGFRGVIEIHSAAGEFFATATAERPTLLGRKLLVRLRRQLNRWKSSRFSHESIRRPSGRWLTTRENKENQYAGSEK